MEDVKKDVSVGLRIEERISKAGNPFHMLIVQLENGKYAPYKVEVYLKDEQLFILSNIFGIH